MTENFLEKYRWKDDGNCYSQGRNGAADTVGINFEMDVFDTIRLAPVLKSGREQNCWIRLPPAIMTQLAVDWLRAKGYMVVAPPEKEQA